MAKHRNTLPARLQPWVVARRKFHLSHAEVQMARELGMNPKKLGKLANHKQEPWKLPLPQFLAHVYAKRFGRPGPEHVRSIEDVAAARAAKKAARKAAKTAARSGPPVGTPTATDVARS